ncbi:RHS repeat-associated core domain-containing protein [Pseudomonas sp. GL-B-26]|uniref:RHS repeat-associated core domain-containing protein n=1 Tax=Pseudomonas sp. GL-B-26 TaxID=2832394 RepID=UPI001CBD0937|nr:RHS repeat-associated core domain-containing protein [Pseudomonas sp. GL-B-26]
MGMHHKTPGLSVVDPRGLSIRSVDYWRAVEGDLTQARINRTFYDAAGRAVEQWDPRLWALKQEEPLTSANLTTVFSLSGNALFTDSVDAGWQLTLSGLGNEVLLGWDSRGTRREVEYDPLLRPVAVFEQGETEPRRSAERMAYGGPDHGVRNQCGQLIRHDDPAGTVLFEAFSITGQCVKQIRHFTLDSVAPDWPALEADRQRLLEPGEGAISTWNFGPLNDVLEQIDAKENRQTFRLTLDGRLRETRLQLQGLTTWQTLVSDIQYNAEGKVEREVAGNDVQTTLKYCPENGRLTERQAYSDRTGTLQHLIYLYDRMGNVLSIEDKALPVRYFANQRIEPISRFIYDSLSQLIEAFGWEAGSANQGPASVGRVDPAAVSNYRQTYSYDESGNLRKLTHVGAQGPGREVKAARDSNRCLPWRDGVPPTEEAIAAAFDTRGNLLELDQGRLLRWDLRNQLQSVSPVERVSGLNDREAYVYDGGGQRVRKIRSLNTNARTVVAEVRYLPGVEIRTDSGTGKVLQVITAQAGLNSVRVLHWETDPPPGVSNDQYRYNLVDHLNSCTLELADDARIISRETYYPFGATAWSAGPNDTDGDYKTVRYSGKERDATGLYYYGFRYYIPWLQRWTNPDPAGPVDGLNYYAIVENNPVTFVDVDGYAKGESGVAPPEKERNQSSVKKMASVFGARNVAPEINDRSVVTKPVANVLAPINLHASPVAIGKSALEEGRGPEDKNRIDAEKRSENSIPGGSALSTSDVSMSYKNVTTVKNRREVVVQRLVVVFHRKFDLVEGKNLPKWPDGHEIVPSQDWINKEGIEEYERFNLLEGAEREQAVAAIKAKDPTALKIGLGVPVYAHNSETKIITLQDGHHRFIAAAKGGGTVELDSSRGPTSILKWRDLKFSIKKPLKV